MNGINLIDRETLQHALVDHRKCTKSMFLVWLEQKYDRPFEDCCPGKAFGSAKKHRGMPIVTAGMHDARHLRDMVMCAGLRDWKGIHIGPKRNRAVSSAFAQHTNDACAHVNFKPEFAKFVRDDGLGSRFLKAQFRMSVKIVAK